MQRRGRGACASTSGVRIRIISKGLLWITDGSIRRQYVTDGLIRRQYDILTSYRTICIEIARSCKSWCFWITVQCMEMVPRKTWKKNIRSRNCWTWSWQMPVSLRALAWMHLSIWCQTRPSDSLPNHAYASANSRRRLSHDSTALLPLPRTTSHQSPDLT